MKENRIAPDGYLWVCNACGKTSKDEYGYSDEYPDTSWGWDASCSMNCKLYEIKNLIFEDKIVKEIKEN